MGSRWQLAGLIPGGSSTTCIRPPAPRSPARPCAASASFTPSKPRSAAGQPTSVARSVTHRRGRWSRLSSCGWRLSCIACRRAAAWPMLSVMASLAGQVELDTNTVERAIRPIALGRKNHLFAGSDGGADRWAIVCSLITTAKLNDREPYAYLKDVLERMTNGHPVSRLDELLPWNWIPPALQS